MGALVTRWPELQGALRLGATGPKIGNSADRRNEFGSISRTGCCRRQDQRDVAPSALARVDGGLAATVTTPRGLMPRIWSRFPAPEVRPFVRLFFEAVRAWPTRWRRVRPRSLCAGVSLSRWLLVDLLADRPSRVRRGFELFVEMAAPYPAIHSTRAVSGRARSRCAGQVSQAVQCAPQDSARSRRPWWTAAGRIRRAAARRGGRANSRSAASRTIASYVAGCERAKSRYAAQIPPRSPARGQELGEPGEAGQCHRPDDAVPTVGKCP